MNGFDAEAELSKISIAAMFLGLFGAMLGAASLVDGLFNFDDPMIILDIGGIGLGIFLMWAAARIANIAYKNAPGGEKDEERHLERLNPGDKR